MNEIIALLVLSVLVNIALFWFCREALKYNDDLLSTCADFMAEIIELRTKIKKLEGINANRN